MTIFTYKPSLVKIDARNSSYRGNRPTNKQKNKQTNRSDYDTLRRSLARSVIICRFLIKWTDFPCEILPVYALFSIPALNCQAAFLKSRRHFYFFPVNFLLYSHSDINGCTVFTSLTTVSGLRVLPFLPARRSKRGICYGNVAEWLAGWMSHAGIVSKQVAPSF